MLEGAGWTIDGIDATSGQLAVGGPSTYAEAIEFTTSGGPLARAMADQPDEVRTAVEAALTDELAGFYDGEALTMGYGCWHVRARN